MRIAISLIAALSLLTLSACNRASPPQESNRPANGSRVSDNNVFKDQVRALEKAEQVQQIIMDDYKKRNTRMDRLIDDQM